MRQKINKRLNDILAELRDLGNIATINDDPVRHQTKLSRAEPSKEDFTTTLSAICSSDADRVPVVEVTPGPSPFSGIEPFSLAEVQEAMFKMRCGRGADGDGLVLELFKYVYMLVWCAFTMKYFAQDNLIHLGDTRCSQWFRKVGICNKPRTGGQ